MPSGSKLTRTEPKPQTTVVFVHPALHAGSVTDSYRRPAVALRSTGRRVAEPHCASTTGPLLTVKPSPCCAAASPEAAIRTHSSEANLAEVALTKNVRVRAKFPISA